MTRPADRLRIAMQKSGRLADPARNLLKQAGFEFRIDKDQLFCYGESCPIDLVLVRDDDIPQLVAENVCDLGIVGRNVLIEKRLEMQHQQHFGLQELMPLYFGACRLSLAAPNSHAWQGTADLQHARIATSYPEILAEYLQQNAIAAEIVHLKGSVEIATKLGKADFILDLVSTGATLVANGLREVESILVSEAVLACQNTPFGDSRDGLLQNFLARIEGVMKVQASKLIICQTEKSNLDALLKLLPDALAPTISQIWGNDGAVNLQALCSSNITWQRLEDMKLAGARGLMVLPVEKLLA
ncbi:MAG: ATP phosphoribosyltransferase [Arenimonas sp.]|nr:ATP phosphoribosyltransferase [Arenimonas sp.]